MAALLVLCAGPTAAAPAGAAWAQVSWKAGAHEQKAFEDPRLLAEVAPDEAGAQALKEAAPGAEVSMERALVRLWTVTDAAEVLARLPLAARGHFAPVLREGPTTAAKLTVALGGVVVFLKSGVDRAAFVRAHHATDAAGGGLLVPSAPGRAALELASQLSADTKVRLASPNVWTPGTKR